jgi:hypothetical protein
MHPKESTITHQAAGMSMACSTASARPSVMAAQKMDTRKAA